MPLCYLSILDRNKNMIHGSCVGERIQQTNRGCSSCEAPKIKSLAYRCLRHAKRKCWAVCCSAVPHEGLGTGSRRIASYAGQACCWSQSTSAAAPCQAVRVLVCVGGHVVWDACLCSVLLCIVCCVEGKLSIDIMDQETPLLNCGNIKKITYLIL